MFSPRAKNARPYIFPPPGRGTVRTTPGRGGRRGAGRGHTLPPPRPTPPGGIVPFFLPPVHWVRHFRPGGGVARRVPPLAAKRASGQHRLAVSRGTLFVRRGAGFCACGRRPEGTPLNGGPGTPCHAVFSCFARASHWHRPVLRAASGEGRAAAERGAPGGHARRAPVPATQGARKGRERDRRRPDPLEPARRLRAGVLRCRARRPQTATNARAATSWRRP